MPPRFRISLVGRPRNRPPTIKAHRYLFRPKTRLRERTNHEPRTESAERRHRLSALYRKIPWRKDLRHVDGEGGQERGAVQCGSRVQASDGGIGNGQGDSGFRRGLDGYEGERGERGRYPTREGLREEWESPDGREDIAVQASSNKHQTTLRAALTRLGPGVQIPAAAPKSSTSSGGLVFLSN